MTKRSIKIQYFLASLFGILSITILAVNAQLMGEVDIAPLIADLVVATVLALFLIQFCKKDKFKQIKVKIPLWLVAGIALVSCVCALVVARSYSVAIFKDIITVFWILAGALFFVMQKEYLASVSTDRKYILRKKFKWTCIFFLICMAFMLAVTMICAPGNAVWAFKENIDNLLHNAALWGKGSYSFELSNLTENDNPAFVLLYYHGYVLVIGYLILNFLHTFVAVKYAKRCKDSSDRSSSTAFLYQAALYALILRFILSILFGLNLIPLPVHPVMSGQGLSMTFDLVMIILICQNGVKSIRNMNLSRDNDEIQNQ